MLFEGTVKGGIWRKYFFVLKRYQRRVIRTNYQKRSFFGGVERKKKVRKDSLKWIWLSSIRLICWNPFYLFVLITSSYTSDYERKEEWLFVDWLKLRSCLLAELRPRKSIIFICWFRILIANWFIILICF
jgi:hypothetical protein